MRDKRLLVVSGGSLASNFPVAEFEARVRFMTARTDEELRQAVREAEVLYTWQIPENVPRESPHLRWIQLPSAGADHIRQLPVWESAVTITASQGVHTVPMAEHFFALLLSLSRQIAPLVRAQSRGEWVHDTRQAQIRLVELRGKTLGIIGWGKIGAGVAHIAHAFGMRVVGTRWSAPVPRELEDQVGEYEDPPWLEPTQKGPDTVYPADRLGEVLSQSDIVLLLLPLTDGTKGSFGQEAFGSMKRGALFFNLGRGAVVDENALIQALQEGSIAGAGLDVFEHEPLPRSSPLWSMPNVIVSPHIGGLGEHTRERGAHLFEVNLRRFLDGQPLLNMVDREGGY